jgi:hypothetical protein
MINPREDRYRLETQLLDGDETRQPLSQTFLIAAGLLPLSPEAR